MARDGPKSIDIDGYLCHYGNMEEYLSVKEAALLLRVGEGAIRKALDNGTLPFVNVGPKVRRIPASALIPGPGAHPQTINKVA